MFKLNRPLGLLLHYSHPISDYAAGNNVANLHFNDVAATQLPIDRQCSSRKKRIAHGSRGFSGA
jgi:hypothetical protein